MTLRTRRYIFWTFLVLFILVGTGAIFYSAGWRLTAETCKTETLARCLKIQRTGAILAEAKQKGISISVNDEIFADKSGIMQSGTLINGLLPKNYHVEIQKDGYAVWRKNVEVEPQLVSKLSGIILVPEKTEVQDYPIAEKMSSFNLGNKEKIAFEQSGALYYRDSQSPALKLRGNKFVSWNSDKTSFIVKDSSKNVFYLYKTSDLSKIFNVSVSFNNLKKNSQITKISFHPSDPDKMIIQTKTGLEIFDSARLKTETASVGSVVSWAIDNPNLYYVKKIGNATSTNGDPVYGIFSFNLIIKNETKLYEFSEKDAFDPNGNPEISAKGKTLMISERENLFVFNSESKKMEKRALTADTISVSPDGKKAVFRGAGDKITVYFLEDAVEEFHKKAGETIDLDFYSDSLGIKNIAWHKDSKHLLVEYLNGDNISTIGLTETDFRLPINSYELADGSNMDYDAGENKVYFLQGNKLEFIDLEAF